MPSNLLNSKEDKTSRLLIIDWTKLSIYGTLSRMDKGQLKKIINKWPPNDRFLRKKYPER